MPDYGIDANGNPVPSNGGGTQQCPAGQTFNEATGKCEPRQGGSRNLEYWKSQGVTEGDIFDLKTGQTKPGWARTAEGYDRIAPKRSAREVISGVTGGLTPSSASLDPILAALQAEGINARRATRAGGAASDDKIILPGGQIVDLLRGVSEPNPVWQYLEEDGSPKQTSWPFADKGGIGNDVVRYLEGGPKWQPTAPPIGYTPAAPPVDTFRPAQAPPAYRPGQAPSGYRPTGAPSIQAGELPTYSAAPLTTIPDFRPSSLRGTEEDVIRRMLSSTSLSPEVVAQMKESQKGSILSRTDQLKQEILQSAAGRGVVGGGATTSALGEAGSRSLEDISKAFRDIDIRKAIQDREDELAAVGAANTYGGQLLREFLEPRELRLRGETAQAGEGYREFLSNQERVKFQEEQDQRGFERWLSEQGVQQTSARDELSRWLGEQGVQQVGARGEFDQWLGEQNLSLQGAKNTFDNWAAVQGLGMQKSLFDLNRWAQEQGLRLSAAEMEELARRFGITTTEGARQFDIGNQLGVARFLAGT